MMHEPGRQHEGSNEAARDTPAPRLGREHFEPDELAVVLSHFDVGLVEQAHALARGSRRAPKLLLRTARGPLLLKRLAAGSDEPGRVAFRHEVQRRLSGAGFRLPRDIPPRGGDDATLRLGDRTYELYEFVPGWRFTGTLDETESAGRALGDLHVILGGWTPEAPAPAVGWHASPSVGAALAQIPTLLGEPDLVRHMDLLAAAYADASAAVDAAGYHGWPRQVIHGDWHPGNLLFRGGRVAAVLDFDTARCDARAVDVAGGALHFSFIAGGSGGSGGSGGAAAGASAAEHTPASGGGGGASAGDDPAAWPDYLDESRLGRFCAGYDGAVGPGLTGEEVEALAPLMIESLIAESATRIGATGSFDRLEGGAFLRMIERKVLWLQENAGRLGDIIRRLSSGRGAGGTER